MKKGFTLIELLAVIVILAIIALIATPIILNIIEDSKKSAATNSAQLYVDGLTKHIAKMNLENEFNPSSCTITNGSVSCDETSLNYEINGQAPTSGTITFTNGVVTAYTLGISGYTVTKNGSTITTTKGEPTIEFNGTYVVGGQNDTYIGIAYLDPTNLSTTCTAQLAAQNLNDEETPTPTGITSGCMKFYVYSDDGTNYSMILDHNTSGDITWENSSTNEVAVKLLEDTTDWQGEPRFISADEIAHIVGADTAIGFNSDDSNDSNSDGFYFDNMETCDYDNYNPVVNSTNKSRYAWLYDNTYECEDYGCNIEDSNSYSSSPIYGYWTSSATSYSFVAWSTDYNGCLIVTDLGLQFVPGMGVRPVITLPKSIFE